MFETFIFTFIGTSCIISLFDCNPLDRIVFFFWFYYRKHVCGHFLEEILSCCIRNNDLLGVQFILKRYKGIAPSDDSIEFCFTYNYYYMILCLLEEYQMAFDINTLHDTYSERISNYLHMKRTYLENKL